MLFFKVCINSINLAPFTCLHQRTRCMKLIIIVKQSIGLNIHVASICPATVAQPSNSVETRFSFASFSPRSRSKTNVKRLTSPLRCKFLTTSTHQPNVVAKYALDKNVALKTKESIIQEGALTISFGTWTVPAHFKDAKIRNVSSSILIYEHFRSRLACVTKQTWYLLK